MIPEPVYNHVKYGNGARPSATLEINESVSYSLYRENGQVHCKRYTVLSWQDGPYGTKRILDMIIEIVPMRSVPESTEWDCYFTHEC